MALSNLRLALMTFAQGWDGATLRGTVIVLPSGDPFAPLLGAGTAAFAGASIALRAGVIGSLDALPVLGASVPLVLDPSTPVSPPNAAAVWTNLRDTANPVDQLAGPPSVQPSGFVRKALPESYTALLPPGSDRAFGVASADDFGCTLRGQRPAPPNTAPRVTSWGQIVSHALRNPFLADTLGLRYAFAIGGMEAQAFSNGGWLYVTLDAADGGTNYAAAWTASPDLVKVYATRIPSLTATPRQVFTAVLFPVANPADVAPTTPDEAEIDLAIIEAERYDDGFARLVHARQPDSLDAHVGDAKVTTNAGTDAGIQLGWDDEQVLVWHNRQLAIADAQRLPAGEAKLEAPLGVLGYRVDVRLPTPGETAAQAELGWQSLMQANASVPPALANLVPAFSGELVIEPTPSSPGNARDFWLPLYFAQWRGTPLGTRDDVPHLLAGGTAAKASGASTTSGDAITLPSSRFTGSTPIRLLYGKTYQFRTRLSDLSGGGPLPTDTPLGDSAGERSQLTFARWVPPKGIRLNSVSDTPHVGPQIDRIEVTRPIIGYPEAIFTPRYGSNPAIAQTTVNALLAQLGIAPDGTLPAAPPASSGAVTVGVPDPDVDSLEIVVEVRSLAHDVADDTRSDGAFTFLYATSRAVPVLAPLPPSPTPADVAADTAIPALELAYVDIADVTKIVKADSGPIVLPRSRDVRLRITPIASGPAGYFGLFPAGSTRVPVTRGCTSYVIVRAPAAAEEPLFAALAAGTPAVQALFFRPDVAGNPVATLMHDLAERLGVEASGLTLRGNPGERVLFGCTGFKGTISSDGGSLTFASSAEIFHNWTVATQWQLARDWTWDGLANGAIQVETVPSGGTPVEVGAISVPHIATPEYLENPNRTYTRLVFLHAIDPNVFDARDGFSARDPYRFSAALAVDAGGPPAVETSDAQALELPVASNPSGVPQLLSAGYALSAYNASADYSSTASRHRQLWLEMAAAPATGDGLFARILAYAPDPLLYSDAQFRETPPAPDPTLNLDPELVRTITPRQPSDTDGLEAMVQLVSSDDDPVKYLLPLPPGLADNDPRLFGLWTYEFRFGHTAPWSLANARFGRPLRVTGIQHPAPELPCVGAWQLVREFSTVARPLLSEAPASPVIARSIANGGASSAVSGVGLRVPSLSSVSALAADRAIVATAKYARPVRSDGSQVGSGFPYTTIGFLLYAQALRADGSGYRNVLIAHLGATHVEQIPGVAVLPYQHGKALFDERGDPLSIVERLAAAGLPAGAPLSVAAVEFYPPGGLVENADLQFDGNGAAFGRFAADAPNHARLTSATGGSDTNVDPDPFEGNAFGTRRILRTSRLVKVEPYC